MMNTSDTSKMKRAIIDQVRVVMYGDGNLKFQVAHLARLLADYDGVPPNEDTNRLLNRENVGVRLLRGLAKALDAHLLWEPKSFPPTYQFRMGGLYITLTGDKLTVNNGQRRIFNGDFLPTVQ
jgi:hypothetical protein